MDVVEGGVVTGHNAGVMAGHAAVQITLEMEKLLVLSLSEHNSDLSDFHE